MQNRLSEISIQSPSSSPCSSPLHQPPPQKIKGYHVVPQDDQWTALRQPLHGDSLESGPLSPRTSRLASARVQRDQLMRKMEDLILKEAELASAYELFDYTRHRCSQEHAEIVAKFDRYEAMLREVQERESELRDDAESESVLKTEQDRAKWQQAQAMVHTTLPELLTQLEQGIDVNNAKLRNIQEKIDEIRAHRLALREEIALKEEDIALALQ